MSVLTCDREGSWRSRNKKERSPIYALPALGNDEGGRECLTGYLQRLAGKHHLFCGDMPRGLVSEYLKWCPECLKEQIFRFIS